MRLALDSGKPALVEVIRRIFEPRHHRINGSVVGNARIEQAARAGYREVGARVGLRLVEGVSRDERVGVHPPVPELGRPEARRGDVVRRPYLPDDDELLAGQGIGRAAVRSRLQRQRVPYLEGHIEHRICGDDAFARVGRPRALDELRLVDARSRRPCPARAISVNVLEAHDVAGAVCLGIRIRLALRLHSLDAFGGLEHPKLLVVEPQGARDAYIAEVRLVVERIGGQVHVDGGHAQAREDPRPERDDYGDGEEATERLRDRPADFGVKRPARHGVPTTRARGRRRDGR